MKKNLSTENFETAGPNKLNISFNEGF